MEIIFVFILVALSLWLIWSKPSVMINPRNNALKNYEAYYHGFTLASQKNHEVKP